MRDDNKKKKLVPDLTRRASESVTTAIDDASTLEAKQLGAGKSEEELKNQALANEHSRAEKFKDHFEIIAVVGLYLAAAALAFVGGVLFMHMVLPKNWHWLTADQMTDIKNMITGGVLAGIVAGHLRKRI